MTTALSKKIDKKTWLTPCSINQLFLVYLWHLYIISNTFRMGVVGFSKTLARELGPYGILVNTMGPGRIYTDRIKYLNKIRGEKIGLSEEEYTKKDSAGFPQRRYQTTDEYGRTAVYLISPANGSLSGQAFINDGAMTTSY